MDVTAKANSAEIITQVNALMHEGFEIPMEKLRPEAELFSTLGLDSLDAVDMLVHLEERLGVKIEGERLMNVKTLQDVYNLAEELSLSNNGSNAGQKQQVSH